MIDSEAKKNLEKNLSEEEVKLLLDKTPKIKLKFKLIEFFNK